MKLKELLEDYFKKEGELRSLLNLNGYYIGPEVLKLPEFQKLLLSCDEFKGVEKINVLDYPFFFNKNKEKKHCSSILFYDKMNFKKEILIHSLFLTNAQYVFDSSKNFYIQPIQSTKDLELTNEIRIKYSVEKLQDNPENYKKELIENLKEILDNPNNYKNKALYSIVMRCYLPKTFTDDVLKNNLNNKILVEL